eukprot:XP_001690226.1 predicted protein [Chlamydomonas reinhardtii]
MAFMKYSREWLIKDFKKLSDSQQSLPFKLGAHVWCVSSVCVFAGQSIAAVVRAHGPPCCG